MSQMDAASAEQDDPYLWLEEIASPQVRAWIEAQNGDTTRALCDDRFAADRRTILDLLNADDRIPFIRRRGLHVYNFWQDAAHPKGLWRRTTLADFRCDAPSWDILLDLDALAKDEGEDWVWQGCTALPPDYRRGLVRLSRGGADAATLREFDLIAKRLVPDGFVLPEAKSDAAWLDADRLLVASALGGEEFQTTSGYARTVRLWERGKPFAAAPIVFEAGRTDMYVGAWRSYEVPPTRILFARARDFVHRQVFVDDAFGRRLIDTPADAHISVYQDWLAVNLRSDWNVNENRYAAGALLVIGFAAFMAGERGFTVLFRPSDGVFLQHFEVQRDAIAFTVLDHVRSRVVLARHAGREWRMETRDDFPEAAVLNVQAVDTDFSDAFVEEPEAQEFLVFSNNAITPATMSLVRHGTPPERLKQAPPRFDAQGLAITQHHAVADDGTRIPYFQVARGDLIYDHANPVLLTGYGGFQISSLPHYAVGAGKLWLERGGVHVIANIRGGGEFGPDWHKAGMREGKRRAHDDFAAVARDLMARGVTRPPRLACWGGSNGGLLVGNMLTRYPDLFGAVICGVPLLDMLRYAQLSAGPSWIAEYGDPENPHDREFLRALSAYHNIATEQKYPPILLTTSARDDRVHPGHARKMAAKLAALGHRVYFHEPPEGGHAGATDNAHLAFNMALSYAFLRHTIAPEMTLHLPLEGGGRRPKAGGWG